MNDSFAAFYYLGKPFDATFHSNLYQKLTSYGPLQTSLTFEDKAINFFFNTVKKTVVTGISVMELLKGNQHKNEPNEINDTKELKDLVNNYHFPSYQNWSRSINSICQGFGGIIVSGFIKNRFFSGSLQLGSIFWMCTGVRHLIFAQYDKSLTNECFKKFKFVWEK